MTTPDPLARTAAALGISPGASPDEWTAAFLRRLPDEGFVPPEECVAVLSMATSAALPVSPAVATEQAIRLQEGVEAFAAAFWSLTPAARRSRWEALRACYPDDPLPRLQSLEPGLDIAVKSHPDPKVDELAGLIRELFALPPRARAVRRAEWLTTRDGDPAEWIRALVNLEPDDPRLAALDPVLVGWLVPGSAPTPITAVAGAMISPQSAPPVITLPFTPAREPWYARKLAGIPLGLIVVAFIMLRGCAALISNTRTAPSPQYPEYKYKPPPEPKAPGFSSWEVARFEDYERLQADPTAPRMNPPSRYWSWRAAGRPGATTAEPP